MFLKVKDVWQSLRDVTEAEKVRADIQAAFNSSCYQFAFSFRLRLPVEGYS